MATRKTAKSAKGGTDPKTTAKKKAAVKKQASSKKTVRKKTDGATARDFDNAYVEGNRYSPDGMYRADTGRQGWQGRRMGAGWHGRVNNNGAGYDNDYSYERTMRGRPYPDDSRTGRYDDRGYGMAGRNTGWPDEQWRNDHWQDDAFYGRDRGGYARNMRGRGMQGRGDSPYMDDDMPLPRAAGRYQGDYGYTGQDESDAYGPATHRPRNRRQEMDTDFPQYSRRYR